MVALGYGADAAQQALTCIERALELRPDDAQARDVRETIREWLAETT